MEQPLARAIWLTFSIVLAIGYAAGAIWLTARRQRLGRRGAWILPLALGLCALARFYFAFVPSTVSVVPISYPLILLDFVLQAFLVASVLVALLGNGDGRRSAESEDRFRLLFEHGGVGMALLSPEGDFLQVNPTLVQMLGYPAEELLGQHLTAFLHAEDRSSSHHLKRMAKEPQYEREKRFLHRDGRIVWARVVRVPVHDARGATRYHATVFIDVTARKQAEEALAASEQRMRLRFHQAFDGICLWSPAGTFLDANPALCRLLGMSREELLGRNIAEVAADAEAVHRHLRLVLERSGDRSETSLCSRNGNLVEVEVNSALLEIESQRLILGICRDISLRKRAEAALRQAEAALREERDFITQILQTAEACILVTDPDGRILRFNNKCQAVSGFGEEEVRGRAFWDCLLPERVVEPVREIFRQLLAADPASTRMFESPWRTRAGEERFIAWRTSVVRDEHGQPRHVISIGLDVTDQRRLEEQVARMRKMETLATLVGSIAHDFNNQLTAILGNLDIMLADLKKMRDEEGEMPAERQPGDEALATPSSPFRSAVEELLSCVLDAERAAQRCARMTARLLTFSRGKLGTMQPIALDQVLGETVRALQHELPANIAVKMHAPAGIAPVAADAAQVQELLLNLATNARDAMPHGGTLTLSLANRSFTPADCVADLEARPGSFVELCVRDTGGGMTPEVRERIFEPFFTTKKVGRGVGLGLSVVFGIVKGHKGWITVRSHPGQGTAFFIYLPAAQASAPEALPAPALAPALAAEGNILVVDDEPMVRDLARIVLERAGFRVQTAEGGEEALDLYRRQASAIDLILLDYTMPRMNGLQVLQELLRLDPEVCVVFSSGYAMDQEVDQLLAAGGRAFVPKPYRLQDLVQTVRQTLAQRKTVMSTET
jgi:PAS domain S-box-containing protein